MLLLHLLLCAPLLLLQNNNVDHVDHVDHVDYVDSGGPGPNTLRSLSVRAWSPQLVA